MGITDTSYPAADVLHLRWFMIRCPAEICCRDESFSCKFTQRHSSAALHGLGFYFRVSFFPSLWMIKSLIEIFFFLTVTLKQGEISITQTYCQICEEATLYMVHIRQEGIVMSGWRFAAHSWRKWLAFFLEVETYWREPAGDCVTCPECTIRESGCT